MEFEESIYNIIKTVPDAIEKTKRYRSKNHENVKQELHNNKSKSKSMGPAKVEINDPKEFMKKRTKEPVLPEKKPFNYSDGKKKPAVPGLDDAPVMGLKTNKNFIHQNAVETIMSVAKVPEANVVDTRKGHKYQLDPSGLHPIFRNKKDYGQSPQYLQKRKEETQKSQAEYDAYVRHQVNRNMMHALSGEEKAAILRGLKVNYAKADEEHGSLTSMLDTPSKVNTKQRLGNLMKQLEDDIELLERYETVYIAT